MKYVYCKYCKNHGRTEADFLNKNNKKMKMCLYCRKKYKKYYRVCCHKKQLAFCKICGGSQICEHKKQFAFCEICDGSQICSHDKQLSTCKICLS